MLGNAADAGNAAGIPLLASMTLNPGVMEASRGMCLHREWPKRQQDAAELSYHRHPMRERTVV